MSWFNYFGLIIVAVLMIPNITFAIVNKSAFENKYKNKFVEILEQIGRYGCFACMIFNIPYLYFDFLYNTVLYLAINGCLCFLYCLFWVLLWKKNGKLKSLSLSIIPTVIFLFSGILLLNIPLMICSVIFGINHIYLSYKNAA